MPLRRKPHSIYTSITALAESAHVDNQLNETTAARAVVMYHPTAKIRLDLRGGGGVVRQQTTSASKADGNDFDYWSAGVQGVYHMNRTTDLRLAFDHSERTSNRYYGDFTRNTVAVGLEYRF